MNRRTPHILERLGFHLGLLVLAAYAATVAGAAGLPVVTVGGAAGWIAGATLAVAVGELGRRPCGALVCRLVDG